MTRTMVFNKDGSVVGLWYDDMEPRKLFRAIPVRATHVLPITEGPHAGKFHCDFSPLQDLLGDGSHAVCLNQAFERYDDAVKAEIQYVEKELQRSFVLSPLRSEQTSHC